MTAPPSGDRNPTAPPSGDRNPTAPPSGDHGTAAAVEILPVAGLPEFRPGDDLGAAIAEAAPWLRDGDVVVVTSKVVSKCEGRIVAAPADAEQRDALRRTLIDQEAVRVLARKGRTLITANRQGIVQAAAGVDGSNVSTTELALLPLDPDASALRLRAALRARPGVEVGVVITDTMGRAWRHGQTLGVDFLGARSIDLADRGDPAVLDSDVTREGRAAVAVHDRPATNDEIIFFCHLSWLPLLWREFRASGRGWQVRALFQQDSRILRRDGSSRPGRA